MTPTFCGFYPVGHTRRRHCNDQQLQRLLRPLAQLAADVDTADLRQHDVEEDEPWTLESPGSYLAFARTPLDEFEAETGLTLSLPDQDEEVDTLGGLVFLMLGRVPARGEVVRHPSGAEIEILDADPRRLKRLRIRVPNRQRPRAG